MVRELVFALEFRGRGEAVPGATGRRRARTEAPSQVLSAVLGAPGVRSAVTHVAGGVATLVSEIERHADGTFAEWGTIDFGEAGRLSFSTVGRGVVGPNPLAAGSHRGAVIWEITGGTGRFAGAQGLITSNFTVTAAGDVVDHQVARAWIA
jgi:hypothetical protein